MNLTLPKQTRAQRRAEANASPANKRAKMRQWAGVLYECLGAKNGANDSAVRWHLKKYEPYTRMDNPESKGLDAAYHGLREYYLGVFEDVALYLSEKYTQKDEPCNLAQTAPIAEESHVQSSAGTAPASWTPKLP